MLSADNKIISWNKDDLGYYSVDATRIGTYNGKEFPLSAYLYNENELYAFWRLTKLLNSPFAGNPLLVETQRLPRGEKFESESTSTFGSACGMAWTGGIINLQDGCLTVSDSKDFGYLYEAVSHEISHQLDFHEGKTKFKSSRRSSQPDYYQVAGYELVEYVKDGKTVSEIRAQKGLKLISAYAGSSLAENFAETMAFFRVSGDHAKKNLSEVHREFTAKNYFKSIYYDSASLMDNWLKEYSPELAQIAFKAVGDCSQSSVPVQSSFFNASDFSMPLLPAMVSCLGQKGRDASVEMTARIKRDDPDGCKTFNVDANKVEMEKRIKPHLLLVLEKYLGELKKDKDYFARIQSFYDKLSDKTMAGNAYVNCYNQDDVEGCYLDEAYQKALAEVSLLNLPDEHARDLADLYVSSHEFETIKAHVEATYRTFVNSHRDPISHGATELWESCLTVAVDDSASPTGSYFSVGDGYMVSSRYNCLNLQFPESLKVIVRNLALEGKGMQHPNEELILMKEASPLLQESLSAIFKLAREEELKLINSLIPESITKTRASTLSSFSWVKDVLNTQAIIEACKVRAMQSIPHEPAYHQRSKVYAGFATDVCRDVTVSPQYTQWLEDSKGQFMDEAYNNLESKVLAFAKYQVKECLEQYPMDTNLNRIRYKKVRESCVMDKWSMYEKSALDEFMSDPLVVKFQIDRAYMSGMLELNRRRIQLKVMKENGL